MKHRSKKTKPDIRAEIEQLIQGGFNLSDGDTFAAQDQDGRKSHLTIKMSAIVDACLTAIERINSGHGSLVMTDAGGRQMYRPGSITELWTAEKYAQDLGLNKFLKEN